MAKVNKVAVVWVRYQIPVNNLFAKDGQAVLEATFRQEGLAHLYVYDDTKGFDYPYSIVRVQYISLAEAMHMDFRVRRVIESIKWGRIKQLPQWKGRV